MNSSKNDFRRDRNIALVVILVILLLGVIFASISGFGPYEASLNGPRPPTLWDWLELLIVPLVLALGALYFSKQQKDTELKVAEEARKTDRELAANRQFQATLESYYDRMSELLLDPRLSSKAQVRGAMHFAQVRTVAAIRSLDGERNRQLFAFLRNLDLISRDEPIINLAEMDFSNIGLSRADLSNVNFSRVNFAGADLSGADLSGTDLTNANFSEANLTAANLTKAVLTDADLGSADLHRAILRTANLAHAKLRGANLSDRARADDDGFDVVRILSGVVPGVSFAADLSNADLTNADLSYADLTNANLSHAALEDAYLCFANLKGTSLDGAKLAGARLHEAKNWTITQLRAAAGNDSQTVHMPDDIALDGSIGGFDRWVAQFLAQHDGDENTVRNPQ